MTYQAPIVVSEASASDRAQWSAYLGAHAEATLFHDWRWLEAVADAYRYEPIRLVARRGGVIVGALPLVDVKSPLFGRALISSAYSIGGGVVAEDEAAIRALGATARALGEERRVRYVELRGGPSPGEGWIEKGGLYAAFTKPLPAKEDAILPFIPRHRRAEVRKAIKFEEAGEIRLRTDASPEEFHRLYAESVRALGTPVFPLKFAQALKNRFGDEADITVVEESGAPLAALFSFWGPDSAMPYFIGGKWAARDRRAYDFLYYQHMRRAVARGVRHYEFGRSKIGSTHYDTKKFWGFEPTPLVYHVALVTAKEPPNVNPSNPKFAALTRAWKKLPLPVANALGPILARNLA